MEKIRALIDEADQWRKEHKRNGRKIEADSARDAEGVPASGGSG